MKKTKCWFKQTFLVGKSFKMMTPSKKVNQPASQEAYEPKLHRGLESTLWWTVCFPNSLAVHWPHRWRLSIWLFVISAQIALGASWPLLELPAVASRWLKQWKRQSKEAPKSDYCVNIRDASEGPVYLDTGLWLKKQICSAGICVYGLSLLSNCQCFEQVTF